LLNYFLVNKTELFYNQDRSLPNTWSNERQQSKYEEPGIITCKKQTGMSLILLLVLMTPEIPRYDHGTPCYCAMSELEPQQVVGNLQHGGTKQQLRRSKYLCVHLPSSTSPSRFILLKNQMPNLNLAVEEIIKSKIPWREPLAAFFAVKDTLLEDSLYPLPKLVICFSDSVRYYAAHRSGGKNRVTLEDPLSKASLVYESLQFAGFPECRSVLEHLCALTGIDRFSLTTDILCRSTVQSFGGGAVSQREGLYILAF
jgi:hypothetical protein